HTLATQIQADNISGFTDLGGVVSYVNRARRFNWGLEVDQIPYVTGALSNGITSVNGQNVYVEQTLVERMMDRGVMAQGFYPFDSTLRAEIGVGYRSIGFDTRLQTAGFSLQSGQQIIDTQDNQSSPSIHMFEGTAALV